MNELFISSNQKRLPPYGKELINQLSFEQSSKNDIFLFIEAKPWRQAQLWRQLQHVLAFSPTDSPYEYEWPVRDYSVLVFDKVGIELVQIEQLAHALLLEGATIVRVLLFNSRLVIYRRN